MTESRSLSNSTLLVLLVSALLIGAVAGAAVVGSLLGPSGSVRIAGDVSGTVTLVNEGATAVCLDETTGSQLCTRALVPEGLPSITTGAIVTATHLWIADDGGASDAILVTSVLPPTP